MCLDWYIYRHKCGIKTKPDLQVNIFRIISLSDPCQGRGFHAGRLVTKHGKCSTTIWFCFNIARKLVSRSSSVEQNPRYDTKFENECNNIQNYSAYKELNMIFASSKQVYLLIRRRISICLWCLQVPWQMTWLFSLYLVSDLEIHILSRKVNDLLYPVLTVWGVYIGPIHRLSW